MNNIVIRKGKKGNGVFAKKDFAAGEVIEICPVITSEIPKVPQDTWSDDYVYLFGEGYGFVLGYGSFYNHSYKPNAIYIRNIRNSTMIYVTVTPIKKDEEILVNYNGDIYSKEPLWFDCIE